MLSLAVPIAMAILAGVPAAAGNGNGSAQSLWASPIRASNLVVSSPTTGGGYPDPSLAPQAGTCRAGTFNSNHSESWITVQPGTEHLVGSSKFFFENFSTAYNFYLGSYNIQNGVAGNNIIQGYDCTTVGTQAMPPSWTNTTDPNVAFDTRGRVYQTMLPFNAFWTNLHPDGAINISFSDDFGAQWTTGNGGQPLEMSPNASSFQLGHVEDKQWIAVNHFAGNQFQDHVYAMWSVFNGCCNQSQVRVAVSRDRGATFSKAVRITPPQVDQQFNTFIYPGIDPQGTVYIAYAAFPNRGGNSPGQVTKVSTLFVAKSTDDGQTFGNFVPAATVGLKEGNGGKQSNTTFRDGIIENFAVSPTFPGHLYLTYEDWDGTQFDVKFTQSTDGGATWSTPVVVNDNVDRAGVPTDQFQPSVAAGPNGGVAIAFYDRRVACPNDPSVIPQDVGRTNFCIDVSVQPYKDSGSGAVAVGPNSRASTFTWDPQQPGLLVNPDGTTRDLQTLGGLGQIACAAHNDPCTTAFIGDYFGLAVSGSNIYTLSVSTHYPSGVLDDNGQMLFYQQQVLGTISRSDAGI